MPQYVILTKKFNQTSIQMLFRKGRVAENSLLLSGETEQFKTLLSNIEEEIMSLLKKV